MISVPKAPALSWALAGFFSPAVLVAYYEKKTTAARVPDSAETHLASGLEWHRRGDVQAAIREYLAAASLNPSSTASCVILQTSRYTNELSPRALRP